VNNNKDYKDIIYFDYIFNNLDSDYNYYVSRFIMFYISFIFNSYYLHYYSLINN